MRPAWPAPRQQLFRPVADHPGVVAAGRAGEGVPEPLRADPVRGLAHGRRPALDGLAQQGPHLVRTQLLGVAPDQVQGALRHGVGALGVPVGPEVELRKDVAERLADVLRQGAHGVPFQHRDPLPQVSLDQVLPDSRVLEDALGIDVHRGAEGLGALLEPRGLGGTRQQPPAELALHLPGNPVRRHQVVEQAEGGARGDSGAIDGGEQGMQVPGLDRPSALQDQAAQRQHVVLGDRVEEVLGHLQGQVDQAGRCDGRFQSQPGQVQPRQADPRRAVEAAGLGGADPQEVAGDRSDQVRLALGENT